MTIVPRSLKPGDNIRVVAPARQITIVSDHVVGVAKKRLEDMGYLVTFGKNIASPGLLSSSVEERVADIHDAFADSDVNGIFTVIGGFNSNELLEHLDYDLIRSNPKPLIGYSDITALQNAIYAQTGLVTYSGPHFSSFGEELGFEYTQEYFQKALNTRGSYDIHPSEFWSADRWYKDQQVRNFKQNAGYQVIQEGVAEGTVIGGNLCTFNLLQGTEYMPSLEGAILFLEEDQLGLAHIGLFARNIASLAQQSGFDSIKAIVFGRFHPECDIDMSRLEAVIQTHASLKGIPIIANMDFGHTEPRITFPIGGVAQVSASKATDEVTLVIKDSVC